MLATVAQCGCLFCLCKVTIPKVRKLQETLHAIAKSAPTYRFYALYDKVYRRDVLRFAFGCCFENGGAVGVDGVTFDAIEAYGWERWVDELAEDLRKGTYRGAEGVEGAWGGCECGPERVFRQHSAHWRHRNFSADSTRGFLRFDCETLIFQFYRHRLITCYKL